jgi:hypothetical protein
MYSNQIDAQTALKLSNMQFRNIVKLGNFSDMEINLLRLVQAHDVVNVYDLIMRLLDLQTQFPLIMQSQMTQVQYKYLTVGMIAKVKALAMFDEERQANLN